MTEQRFTLTDETLDRLPNWQRLKYERAREVWARMELSAVRERRARVEARTAIDVAAHDARLRGLAAQAERAAADARAVLERLEPDPDAAKHMADLIEATS